jgi:hypothetical protein
MGGGGGGDNWAESKEIKAIFVRNRYALQKVVSLTVCYPTDTRWSYCYAADRYWK